MILASNELQSQSRALKMQITT